LLISSSTYGKILDGILVAKTSQTIALNQNLEDPETTRSTLRRPPHYQQILTFLASTIKMANAAIGGFFYLYFTHRQIFFRFVSLKIISSKNDNFIVK
jgi:hypothetical protein